ncbi:hypothetical protein L914_04212, partial [Phytophthora nicotianae]
MLLQSKIDTSSYLRMRGSWKLSRPELFGLTYRSVRTYVVHVLVVVPALDVGSKRPADDEIAKVLEKLKLFLPKTLTEFIPLSLLEDEFRLDSLSTTRQSVDPIVMTPTVHKIWKGFGEFPPYYFVRMEQVVFWKVIKKLLFGEDRVVIVGSPSVGKSCFLMLLPFYRVFRKEKGSYSRLANLSLIDIMAVRLQAEGTFVLIDGPNQDEAEDAKNDSRIVVLPAWRDADLLQYGKLTNRVIEAGLRKIKRQNTPWPKLVKKQYFYSGGCL